MIESLFFLPCSGRDRRRCAEPNDRPQGPCIGGREGNGGVVLRQRELPPSVRQRTGAENKSEAGYEHEGNGCVGQEIKTPADISAGLGGTREGKWS